MFHTIKQLEERNVLNEITCMKWCDRMDLVAIANNKGEVSLHRLTWVKAWILNPPQETLVVKAMTWRPDGKILAVAYSSGDVVLVKVENREVLRTINVSNDISCLYWVQEKTRVKNEAEIEPYMKYIDFSLNFLSDPPAQSYESNESEQKSNILQEQTELNLLLIGTMSGLVHVSIFGCFPCAIIDINKYLASKDLVKIKNLHLTEDLSKLFVTVTQSGKVKIIQLNSSIFKTHTSELFSISIINVKLISLLDYLSSVITQITETWESILLELDRKLSKYAGKVPENGLTADFLELLMFGICSNEMEEFLIHDLTKKGLEKFGQTIETSYTSIQKLLLKYLMNFGQNVTYHLTKLRGMARLESRYQILGLSETTINEAIQSNGAFLIKGGEMQQIINLSIINYKAFFRWLYTAIMHLMDEQIPEDIPRMTQQDLAYITEFLQNFDQIGRKNTEPTKLTGFTMERLGQYLQDCPLRLKPDMSGNEWSIFLTENNCLAQNDSILRYFEDMSLLQQFKHLSGSIERIFDCPKNSINEQFEIVNISDYFSYDSFISGQINRGNTVLFAFLHINLHLLQIDLQQKSVKCASFYFTSKNGDNLKILDAKFYSDTILSLLLQDSAKFGVLYQLSLVSALEHLREFDCVDKDVPLVNGCDLEPKLMKFLEGMDVVQFAVSGSRRVGLVLSDNRRKVKLFEMEADEEEDEDADMTATTTNTTMNSTQDTSSEN